MNIAFPLLLLIFGGLTLWLLSDSSLRWHLKVACISIFCVFTLVFWSSIHTFLGWAADENDMPEIVNIHWVVIKEPSAILAFEGQIFFLLESSDPLKEDSLLEFFSYRKSSLEPRLFVVPYSRKLHEQVEKEMMPKLKAGQLVRGKFQKNNSKDGKGKEKGETGKGKGAGDESQKQDWIFHLLLPSQIHKKY